MTRYTGIRDAVRRGFWRGFDIALGIPVQRRRATVADVRREVRELQARVAAERSRDEEDL